MCPLDWLIASPVWIHSKPYDPTSTADAWKFFLLACVLLCGGCVHATGCCRLITAHVSSSKSILIMFEGRGRVGAYWFDRCPWGLFRFGCSRARGGPLREQTRALMDVPVDTSSPEDGRGERQGQTIQCPSAKMCKHWVFLHKHQGLLRPHT